MNIRVKLNRLIKPFFESGLDFFMAEKVNLSTVAKKTKATERWKSVNSNLLFYAFLSCKSLTIFPRVSPATLSASSMAWTYLFVVVIWACPSRADTFLILAPLTSSKVAEVCRSAWNFLCGSPFLFRKSENISVGEVGYITLPSLWINTQLAPFQAVPSFRRVSACCACQRFNSFMQYSGIATFRLSCVFVSLVWIGSPLIL